MELSPQLSKIIATIKAYQDKLVRVCILVNDDSDFLREISLYIKELNNNKYDQIPRLPYIADIPVWYMSEGNLPPGLPIDDLDILFVFRNEMVEKTPVSYIKEIIKNISYSE